MSPDDPRHGTPRGYWVHRKEHGESACEPCKRAAARYEQERQLDLIGGTQRRIDATGTRRRIQALARIGWPADAIGLPQCQAWHLTQRKFVMRATAQLVSDAYERLSMTLGPSGRTRARAERAGWPPPLAWDDIDDPNERPATGVHRSARSNEELLAEWDHLRRAGESIEQAARSLGVSVGAIEKAAERAKKAAA